MRFHYVPLVVNVLFTICLLVRIDYQHVLSSVFSLVTLNIKKVISVIHPFHRYYLSFDVIFLQSSSLYSSSFESPTLKVLPIPPQVAFPESVSLDFDSGPSPPPLQVYHRCSRHLPSSDTPHSPEAPIDLSSDPTSPLAEDLPEADLLIALRKGNHSIRHSHPIYNCLSYH